MELEIQGSNVEEIRSFSKTVFNSGISVYQCARGYRMERILNNLGVYDDYDVFEHEQEVASIKKMIWMMRDKKILEYNWNAGKSIIIKKKNKTLKKQRYRIFHSL